MFNKYNNRSMILSQQCVWKFLFVVFCLTPKNVIVLSNELALGSSIGVGNITDATKPSESASSTKTLTTVTQTTAGYNVHTTLDGEPASNGVTTSGRLETVRITTGQAAVSENSIRFSTSSNEGVDRPPEEERTTRIHWPLSTGTYTIPWVTMPLTRPPRTTSQKPEILSTDAYTIPWRTVTITEKEVLQFILYQPFLADMETFLNKDHVVEFLSTFTNPIQRSIVSDHLKYCPYYSICNLDDFAIPDEKSCCDSCDCDINTCVITNTCCPNIMAENVFILPNDSNSGVSNPTRKNNQSVETCISKHITHVTQEGFYAIASCPDESDIDMQALCRRAYSNTSDLYECVPVSSKTTGKIYKNKYCASCNGVSEDDMVQFDPIFFCLFKTHFKNMTNIESAVSLSFLYEDCDIEFSTNHVQITSCEFIVDQCNMTGNWKSYDVVYELACSLYTTIMEQAGVKYKNVFCALCNGIVPLVSCSDGNSVKSWTFGFSGLLALDSNQALVSTEPTIDKDDKSSCTSHQFFDNLFEKCRNVSCPDNTQYQTGTCMAMYSTQASNVKYKIDMRLLPKTATTIEELIDVENDLYDEIYKTFQNIEQRFTFCFLEMALKTDAVFSQRSTLKSDNTIHVLYVDVRLELLVLRMDGLLQSPSRLADTILALRQNPLQIDRMNNLPLQFNIVFSQFDSRQFNLIGLVHKNGNILHSLRGKNATDRFKILYQYGFADFDGLMIIPNAHDTISEGGHCIMNDVEQVPILEYTTCPKVSVSSDDIKWTNLVDGILVDGLKIDRSNFYFKDDNANHIMMCLKQYQQLVQHLLPSRSLNAEIIVSIVCSSLSIISLLVTIIVFAIFPKLHKSIPGQNNMSLSVALALAQIMLFVGAIAGFEQFSVACKTTGFLIHFSWLCAVFWMNVCTYHVFVTLTSSELPKQKFDTKKCISYHAYVLVCASVFVGINILISVLESGSIGYGDKYCYITSRERILITFVAPTILIVCINLIMFLYVVFKVSKSSSKSAGVRKSVKHERNDLAIFAKLATLTGISWIFGFLYIWTNNFVLSYIFTVLNAGQGVFIMVSFVLNRRVLVMIYDMFSQTRTMQPIKTKTNGKPQDTSSTMF